MSVRMNTAIKMDRSIDKNRHYISPGGYELVFDDGTHVQFDFENYEGTIAKNDDKVLDCTMYNLDTDSYESAHMLEDHLLNRKITKIEEFYVYTGENDEPDIHPVSIEYMTFEVTANGIEEDIDVPKSILTGYSFD